MYKFTFGLQVHLQETRVRFVYEGHWVKVKVTAAIKREILYPRNVQLQSVIMPVEQI